MKMHPITLKALHYTQTWRKDLPGLFEGTLLTMTYLPNMWDFFAQDLCVLLGGLGKPFGFAPTIISVPWFFSYSRT